MKKENTNGAAIEVLPEKISSDEIAKDLDTDYEYTRLSTHRLSFRHKSC